MSTSPANFLDQTQSKGLVLAVFGLVFSKLAVLSIAPDPLPFCKDTPADIKGARPTGDAVFSQCQYEMLKEGRGRWLAAVFQST